MKEWIPIPGSNKERILKVALEEFSEKGFKGVNIVELASKANMTTGAIYHHFGSKSKLYEIIRNEMEQRILDRMEGAASLFNQPMERLEAAFITGLDFAVKKKICRLVSEEVPNNKRDRIETYFSDINEGSIVGIEIVLLASWRSILSAIEENTLTFEQGKGLIKWIFKKELV